MSWAAFLTALVKVTGALAQYLSERQLIKAGEAAAVAELLRGQLDAFRRANNIRDVMGRELGEHPDRVRDDDGFKR